MTGMLNNIVAAVKLAKGPVVLNGVAGSSKGLVVSQLAAAFPKAPVIVITATSDRALELADDCRFFAPQRETRNIAIYPQSDALPFTRLSPEPDEEADRLRCLHKLLRAETPLVVAPVTAVMRHVPPKGYISSNERSIKAGSVLDIAEFSDFLVGLGFEEVGLVEDEGSFARRGGIIDLWPSEATEPARLELDGDTLISIRSFDPATQRSQNELREVLLIPVRSIPSDRQSRVKAAHRIRERSGQGTLTPLERRSLTQQVHEGVSFSGVETLLPLFHGTTVTLFDYLPAGSLLIVDDEMEMDAQAGLHLAEIEGLWHDTKSLERIVAPAEIVMGAKELSNRVKKFASVKFGVFMDRAQEQGGNCIQVDVQGNEELRRLSAAPQRTAGTVSPVIERILSLKEGGTRVVLTCHNEIQAERLKDIFRWHGIALETFDASFESIFEMSPRAIRLKVGRVSAGFYWPSEQLAVITDEEVFGRKTPRRVVRHAPLEPFMSLDELDAGDFVVHEHHGIGKYLSLAHLTIDEKPGDYLVLEYLGGDKLYLPVYRLNLIGKYIGTSGSVPIADRLGAPRWMLAKTAVSRVIRLMAKELLKIYAERQVFPGFRFEAGTGSYEEFSAAFPFDETPDQAKAIDDVLRDMGNERPMDRLICGDVGYGKTEVAMRAAYLAAENGRQAAVLVPTTVLALQHFENFQRRFEGTPVCIEMLSRFLKAGEQKKVLEGLKAGTVDIVIGTHKLLQKDILFRNLGLLIIDEEHRFGVKDKERIKKLRSVVDCLTLTATPIPRTLNLSLVGIRDISIINTPPSDRLSVSTYVTPFDEGIIRQAMARELARGGQVFFVHNRVETIGSMHARLKELSPEAKIVVGHGQMKESELERVMIDFMEQRADILLCTTIIESGLDIPTANTIIINRADTMGLAELYQLRGRVGRSNVRAYAYLLTPQDGEMSLLAKKRLTVLKRFTELGSGFQIAMHDLEFRGAGNILGISQSGHIALVGYEMYTRLLNREIRKMTGKGQDEDFDPELHLNISAFLPEGYIADQATRIELYRRLASRIDLEEVAEMETEIADRFGGLPPEAKNLIGVMDVKVLARRLHCRHISFDGAQFAIQLDRTTPVPNESIIGLATAEPAKYRVFPPDRLLITADDASSDMAILASAKNSLSRLLACASQPSK